MTNDSKKKVLIIDDDATLREYLRDSILEVLDEDSLRIVEASDGLEAIQKIKNEVFDLVITDVYMPKKNGVEVISFLKTQQVKSKAIVISASLTKEILTDLVTLGQTEIMIKPFAHVEFQTKVKTYIA